MARHVALLLVPIVLVAGACNGDDDAIPITLPPQTSPDLVTLPPSLTTDVATTSTMAVTTTVAESTLAETTTSLAMVTVTTSDGAAPTTQPGEPDWTAIVQGLYDTLDDINADPSLDRIDEYCVDVESPCRDVQGAQIEALVRDGWRVIDIPRTEVLTAALVSTADGKPPLESNLVILEVQLGPAQDGGQVVDSNGEVLFEITTESTGNGQASWFVRHLGGGEWRVVEIQ